MPAHHGALHFDRNMLRDWHQLIIGVDICHGTLVPIVVADGINAIGLVGAGTGFVVGVIRFRCIRASGPPAQLIG